MEIKHKIWLEEDVRVIFGKGRDELLRAIDECQSLNAEAKKVKISYRGAWARLIASDDRLHAKLVELHTQGRGMHLKAEAKALLVEYDALGKKVNADIKRSLPKFHKIVRGTHRHDRPA
ncbi:MAG: molybdenum-binding protein [Syntrophales bacterium LBB04]|nr:molybdenum-binding protein [Syntrophales bacterium LBB04]